MKTHVYTYVSSLLLLAFLYLKPLSLQAQCSGLQATTTTSESRCMATGTITVRATGGSGNYNYKAEGPVITSFTSSNIITGLQPGAYTVTVRDVTKNCQMQLQNVVVSGSYQDPRFLITATDVTCAGNDGTIKVGNQQFGRAPFSYSLVAPSPTGIGTTNTTGFFSNLIAGEYAVQLKDSCGGIQVRRITLQAYSWWFNGVTVTKTSCNTADALIQLKDSKGNVNTAGAAFNGFRYGVVNASGDTTWNTAYQFSVFTGNKRALTFVAKDPCGTMHTYVWNVPANTKPSVSAVVSSNTSCTSFTATVTGAQNLTTPTYVLIDNSNTARDSNSTGVFNNLLYGAYCVHVKDACYDTTIVKCITVNRPVPSANNTVAVSDRTCTTFTASITGQSNFFNPSYCIYNSSGVLLRCNTDGVFTGLNYGSYCIKITDGCTGTVLDRCVTAAKPVATLTNYSITGQTCSSFDVTAQGSNLTGAQYCLYDSLGNVVSCNATGTFTGIAYARYCLRAISCGDTTAALCLSTSAPKPAAATAVTISNKACSMFSAAITGQVNFFNPSYCLYDSVNVQVACNTTGVFDNLPYGSYCIKIKDGCYDTTIVRCFSQTKPAPAISATLQQSNITCASFTAKVTGQKNLFNAQYCLYNAANTLVSCNTTGTFNNLPYGTYCVVVTDGCTGQTLRVCQTFTYDYDVVVTTSKSCTIGNTNLDVSFVKGTSPYTIDVQDPANLIVYHGTTTSTKQITLPALPTGARYTIIGTDACGRKDTVSIVPDASLVTKTITAKGKCPSATWLNGSGDLNITATSNLGTVTPMLIKKDGATFSKTHSFNSGSLYVFSDLEPATYVVEYTVQNCSAKLYDTFALQPYMYPEQGRSSIYQCDNKSISLTADVSGGVGPYNFQIIGSEPEVPSIVSGVQTSATFNINTGIIYSLIRLRTVDACGNATLNDVSVLPLQNIEITADTTCLFNNITLSVDTIEGATYSWFKRIDAMDSLFLSAEKTYNLPFMRQQDIGTYICKVQLNRSCLTRLASFNLTGDCGDVFLPVPFHLTGNAAADGNHLAWRWNEPTHAQYFVVERQVGSGALTALARIPAGTKIDFQFTDVEKLSSAATYRIKAVLQQGASRYTNNVRLQQKGYVPGVYPNPVQHRFTVSLNGPANNNYQLELYSASGQKIFIRTIQNTTQQVIERPNGLASGMYLLLIRNTTTGTTTQHHLLFE